MISTLLGVKQMRYMDRTTTMSLIALFLFFPVLTSTMEALRVLIISMYATAVMIAGIKKSPIASERK